MNSRILNLRLNKIFEQVYGVNEGLSIYEKKALVQGFEDGIMEGFFGNVARKVGKAVGKTKKFVSDTYDKGKKLVDDSYEKGKELAKKAWNNVKDFVVSIKNKIQNGFNDAINYVLKSYNDFKNKIIEVYNSVINDMLSAYNSLKDKSKELANGILEAINSFKEQLKKQKDLLIKNFINKKDNFIKFVTDNYNNLVEVAKSNIKSGYKKLQEVGKKSLEILNSIKNGAITVAKVSGYVIAMIVVGSVQLIGYIGKTIYNKSQELYDISKEQLKSLVEDIASIPAEYSAGVAQGVKNENLKYIKTFENFRKF